MKNQYYAIIAISISVSVFIIFYIKEHFREPYSMEIDAIKDQTDISGIFYRVKVTNTGVNSLTGLEVYLGKNDVQYLERLESGQSFFFYPKPDTQIDVVKVTTKEGIEKYGDYRIPFKGIGLPGSGR
ncbi:MAG: hypothetical protein DA328_06265 [Nitrososphaeraceae archaeon]|nr:hypothetical protein [Nitrososphaeraceae archaeon]